MIGLFSRLLGQKESPGPAIDTAVAFDNIARSVGAVTSRRESMTLALKGLGALGLWRLGVQNAYAQVANCLCNGMLYDPAKQCCVSGSILAKNPVADLSKCPNLTAHPGHVCKSNGCGSDYSQYVVPNSYFGASFKGCCDAHDCCYDACKSAKGSCDTNLRSCMVASCDTTFPAAVSPRFRSQCEGVAGYYFDAVNSGSGLSAWTAAQQASCDCCSSAACPAVCQGAACSSLGMCAAGCYCFQSTGGAGACCPSTPCSGIKTCSTAADCPTGSACTPNTCCGAQGVCQVQCSYVTPAPAVAPTALSRTGKVATTAGYQ